MSYEKIMLNNALLHLYKTKKFKKVKIDVKFIDDISEEGVSYRSLLPSVLEAKTKSHPTKMDLGKALESLYGADFSALSTIRGTKSIVSFKTQIVNPKYVSDNELLENTFKFIYECIKEPLFDNKTVDEEKKLLIEDIDAIIDDKARYANERFRNIMFENEITRLSTLGNKAIIKDITRDKLYDYYQNVFFNNRVDIIIVGDIDDSVIDLCKKYLDFGKMTKIDVIDRTEKIIEEANYVTETVKSNQSHLLIGYRTHHRIDDKSLFAFGLFNSILGGGSSSLLFTNVREKASLCYSVGSSINSLKGYMYIRAGIDKNKYDEALKIIFEQIENIKSGNFSDDLLDVARATFINDIKEDQDSINGIARSIYSDETLNRKFNLDFGIKELSLVTKEEVIAAANTITLDTVYFLKGE